MPSPLSAVPRTCMMCVSDDHALPLDRVIHTHFEPGAPPVNHTFSRLWLLPANCTSVPLELPRSKPQFRIWAPPTPSIFSATPLPVYLRLGCAWSLPARAPQSS